MSVNTNHHRCKESNDFKLTNCYNEFYMKKMNCSFPWLKSYNGSLRKCGANDYLKDLVDLVNKNYDPSSEYYKEIENFGGNSQKLEVRKKLMFKTTKLLLLYSHRMYLMCR